MKRSIIVFAVLTLIIGALYARTLDYPFVFDDEHTVLTNSYIQDPSHIPDFFHKLGMYSGQKLGWGSYRPLMYASLAVNYMMGGLDPYYYHLTNILLHILCSFMVYLLARSLIGFSPQAPGEPYAGDDVRAWPYALGAALLFALHPVQTEPAIYTTARSATLVTFNCLASLWLFIEYRKRGRLTWLLGSAVMFGLALFSKERTVPFLLVFPLIDRYICVKGGCRQRWTSYVPHFVLAASFVALRVQIMLLYGSGGAFVRSFEEQWMSATAALSEYYKLVFFPLNLSIDHDVFTISSVNNVNLLIGAVIIAATFSLFAYFWRRQPIVSALIAWPLLAMSPEILMPIRDLIVEYRLYLPMAGISLLAAFTVRYLLSRMDARQAGAILAACAAVLAAMTILSYNRAGVWESTISIWDDAVSKHPYSARARNNLGSALGRAGKPEAALQHLTEAVRLDPKYADAYNNLGVAYSDTGRLDIALQCFKEAFFLDPRQLLAGYNLAYTLIELRDPNGAYEVYETMIKVNPEAIDIVLNASVVLDNTGNPELAGRLVAEYGGEHGMVPGPPAAAEKNEVMSRKYKKTFRR